MTMFFIPTNSVDGTCDRLVQIAKETDRPIFRWNIDLWQHYEIQCDGHHFLISDPTGREVDASADEVCLLWRKPFTELMRFDGLPLGAADQEQARSQMGQWLHALVALMKPQRRVRLVEPYADRRLPKLYQLWLAREYFALPDSYFSVNAPPEKIRIKTITKPLGSPSVGGQNIFYTRRVDGRQLFRPYPWLLQEALIGGQDVTCVHISGRNHFYVCDYARGADAVDWRVEINAGSQSVWHALDHPRREEWVTAVNRFMLQVSLHYGRLDFILRDGILYFLECNSNGQFGWLDDMGTLALHREFLAAACYPATTVV